MTFSLRGTSRCARWPRARRRAAECRGERASGADRVRLRRQSPSRSAGRRPEETENFVLDFARHAGDEVRNSMSRARRVFAAFGIGVVNQALAAVGGLWVTRFALHRI